MFATLVMIVLTHRKTIGNSEPNSKTQEELLPENAKSLGLLF
jgi:hypothetical protein